MGAEMPPVHPVVVVTMIYHLKVRGVFYALTRCEQNTLQIWSNGAELGKLRLIDNDWHVVEIQGTPCAGRVFIYDHRLSYAILAIEATLTERQRSQYLLMARQQRLIA